MPLARGRWAASLAAASLLGLAAGCYEIPPVVSQDYIGSPAAPGWPPVAAYHTDRLHPRNRWFQRALGGRGPDGEVRAPHADDPRGSSQGRTPADWAELEALAGRILEPEGSDRDRPPAVDPGRWAVTEAIFRSDALAEAVRLRAGEEADGAAREIASLLLRAARGEGGAGPLCLPRPPPAAWPPSLRQDEWIEARPALDVALLPGGQDLRWTRVVRARDGSRAALLRLRVALDESGAPLLLPLASECWELDGREGEESHSLWWWRFDRAEWLAGREPWRAMVEAPAAAIRSLLETARTEKAVAAPEEAARVQLEAINTITRRL